MKIAVASSGQWLDSTVDFHTGRAACFIIYDTEQETFEVIDNMRCVECVHWVGVKSADVLLEAGINAIVVRNIGPNTFRKFNEEKIGVFCTAEDSVSNAIRHFREGKLSPIKAPNCEGHLHLHSLQKKD